MRSKLESGGQEVRALSERVAVLSDTLRIYSNHLWMLLAHFAIVMSIFIIFFVWQCRANCILERKLNTIQETLSSSRSVPISTKSKSFTIERTDVEVMEPFAENLNGSYLVESCRKRDLDGHHSTNSLHARSSSFPSATDLCRRVENIDSLSRPDINTYLATQRNDDSGPLWSQSLSSLDSKRNSCEVGENS